MTRKTTVVNYYGARNDSRCFYCPNSTSRYGMWAYCMAATDYQDLIDRGWRRLGQYCFKPNNLQTCCPSYTIKCDGKEFNFTKSHKKILKKMNNYLKTGQKCENDSSDDTISSNNSSSNSVDGDHGYSDNENKSEVKQSNDETSASAEIKMITSSPKKPIDIDNVLKLIEQVENDNEHSSIQVDSKVDANNDSSSMSAVQPINTQTNSKEECDENHKNNNVNKMNKGDDGNAAKPVLKAKALRQQRKAEKLLAKGISPNASEVIATKKTPKNTEKTLTSFISEMPTDGKHQLKLNLINIKSDEFESIRNAEFDLYTRYQTKVHNDPPADMSEFNDFLCKSPMKHETPDDGPECGYGTFHQQYWLDDTLIAVGVLDIMPRGISSVYFFYDPEYSFLTLGTYGTLREIEFIQRTNQKCPDFRGYYIGFYIPSVPKMLYKGKLQPSYLLCPEKYTWHLLDDDLVNLLSQQKCTRFNTDPQAKVCGDFDPSTDLKYLRLLVDNERCLTYNDYKQQFKGIDNVESNDQDNDNFTEYGKVVGKMVSRRVYLVI